MWYQFGLILSLSLPLLAQAIGYDAELDQRYAPFADWQSRLEPEQLATATSPHWWRSPEAIRTQRNDAELPLSGLHLALDPGHVGGAWAEIEGRNFKIDPQDYPVREGELVLEVARMVKTKLVALGAEVTLLRDHNAPLNPRPLTAYFEAAAAHVPIPKTVSWASFLEYGAALRRVMHRMSVVTGELIERARIVNEVIQPDALISLHINAAPWPRGKDGQVQYKLVGSDHTHVLIFGCLSDAELSQQLQQQQLVRKLTNGSAPIERELGQGLALALGQFSGLPPSKYSGKNATRLAGCTPYLWARNLLLLRYAECPTVLLEPYIANSRATYPRIQAALRNRQTETPLSDDDIFLEYANAVVQGILAVYGPVEN